MDMLTGAMKLELADIREKYDCGQIDADAVAELAEAAIDAELEKPDEEINSAWMSACADLMAYVNREKLAHFPERREDTWQAIHEGIRQLERQRRTAWIKPAVRIAACLALFFGLSVGLPLSWFQGSRTQDPNRPESHESILVTEAKAEDTPMPPLASCETTDFAEVCELLGVTPMTPAWVPDGWQVCAYATGRESNGWHFSVSYAKEGEASLLRYEVTWQAAADPLTAPVPQDRDGEYVTTDNGLTVFLSAGAGDSLAVWADGNSVMRYAGPISEEELLQSISSIP